MDKELQINGTEYRIKQYKFTERSQLLWKVTKMIGEPGAALMSAVLGEGVDDIMDADIDFEKIANAFLRQIDPHEHTEFIRETISSLVVSPKKLNKDQDKDGEEFENYFSEHFADHLPLFVEILGHNLMSAVSEEIKKKLLGYAAIIPALSEKAKAESTADSTSLSH